MRDSLKSFVNDIAVEVNFDDSAYESKHDDFMRPVIRGFNVDAATNPDTNFEDNSGDKLEVDTCEVPVKLEKLANHDSIYLSVNINEITVDALIELKFLWSARSLQMPRGWSLMTLF